MDDTASTGSALFAAALDAVDDCVVVLDCEQAIVFLNHAAEALLGTTRAQANGRPWQDVLELSAGTTDEPPTQALPPAGEVRVRPAGGGPHTPTQVLMLRISHPPDEPGFTILTLRADVTGAPLATAFAASQQQLATLYDRGQVGFWEWNAETRVLTESGYWLGRTLNTQAGPTVSDTVMLRNTHPDDIANVKKALIAHLKGHTEHYEVEQRIRAADGGYIHFLVRGQAVERGADGKVVRVSGTYIDISKMREAEAVLKFALESSQQGVWEWDLQSNRITEHGYWSPRLERYEIESPIDGAALARHMHPEDINRIYQEVLRHLRAETNTLEMEIRLRRRDGSWGDFLVRGRALYRDAQGRVSRMLGTYTDISGYKAQERRLQVALDNGRQGLWEWEPDADRVFFSREWYAMFGYREGSITSSLHGLSRVLHPDELESGYAELIESLPHEGDEFELEHRIRHADGHYLNILSRGRIAERDADGRAVRFIGSHIDITDLKSTEARLIESRQLLETVIDAFPLRVFWKDLDNRYLGANRLFAADAGAATPADLIGKRTHDIDWPGSIAPLLEDDRRLLSGGEEKIVTQRQFRRVDGDEIWVETTKVPIRSPDNSVLGILGIYDDVSDRVRREEQLETIANAFTRTADSRLLETLTAAAARLSGADYAFVAHTDPGQAELARVTACFPVASELRELAFEVRDSPSSIALAEEHCYVGSGAAKAWPQDPILSYRGIEGYAGRRLATADGETTGLFVLLFCAAAPPRDRVRVVLDVFAARTIAELERERALGVLRASEQRLNAAITGGEQGVWEWDVQTDELNLFGQPLSDIPALSVRNAPFTGSHFLAQLNLEDRARQRAALRAYFKGEVSTYEFEGRLPATDDGLRWTLIRGQAVTHNPDGRVGKMIGTITDISDQKRIQSELETSQHLLELVIDTMPQAIFWQDREFRYVGCNQQFADLARVPSPQALIGRRDEDFWWPPAAYAYRDLDQELLAGEKRVIKAEITIQRADGSNGEFELTKVPLLAADGDIIGILGAVHDITVLKEARKAAQRLALYDPLTNLPNRRYFTERLESALAAAARRKTKGALLFIDMDQFKQINDTLGHSVGDKLLCSVSERLLQVTRQEDTVARLGGDEFVVLLPDIASDFEFCAHQAQLVADKIHRSLGEQFHVDHHEFHVTPTIGISLFPETGKSVEDVLKEADTAMYSGKAAGRNVIRFFRREMEEATQHRLRMESDLRQAISAEEFTLFFQPQIDRTGRVSGAEVLIRWNHPERGSVLPGEFIPVAEDCGLIVDIGRWVLDAAFRSMRKWIDAGIEIGELAINVSSRQFRATDFVEDVEQRLARYRVPPHRIVFEITESTVIENVEMTIAIMTRLRGVGIRFALDDFGVGYSSLTYLKRLPLDQVKIDRSFVADIGRDQNDEIICRTIIAMSQHLGLQTVAEGVETPAHLDFLMQLRCDRYQGYLFLPPSPEKDFIAHLREQQDL